MKRGTIRGSRLIDEVELLEKVSVLLDDTATPQHIDSILSAHGTDYATAALYTLLQRKHSKFIAHIDSYPKSSLSSTQSVKIILVPGMFYDKHEDVGADGLLIRTIAEKFGFETELIETHSRGSISVNTKIVIKKLQENQHPNVWIISLSKGSTEVRNALEELRDTPTTKNLRGWISIGGLLKGTPHADHKLRTPISKILWYLTLKVLRIDPAVTEQIACKNVTLQNQMKLDSHIEIIHIAGFPLLSHVEPFLVKKYQSIAPMGPSDGIILLKDLLHISGNVYPVWGADHFLRTSEMSGIIYRMCHYIHNTKNKL